MDIFEQLELSLDENDPRMKNIAAMKALVKNIPSEAGRRYAISKILNDSKYGFTNLEEFPNVDKDYWSPKYQQNYTPPDVEKQKEEEFWEWDNKTGKAGKNSWMNMSKEELARRAEAEGFGDVESYKQKLYEIQNYKNREKLLDDEFGKVGAFGVKMLYPRQTEALLRGEDFGGKEVALDLAEQGLYSLVPAERLLGLVSKGGKAAQLLTKAGKNGTREANWAGSLLGNATNPFLMEVADAAAYGDESNSDRKDFNIGDVGMGTATNMVMGSLVKQLYGGRPFRPEGGTKFTTGIPTKGQVETKASMEAGKTQTKMYERAKQNYLNKLEQIREREKLGLDVPEKLESEADRFYARMQQSKPVRNYRDIKPSDVVKWNAKNLIPDAVSYGSNRAGDYLTEDPRTGKRIVRRLAGAGSRLVGPMINDVVDAYYDTKAGKTERDKVEELLGDYSVDFGLGR